MHVRIYKKVYPPYYNEDNQRILLIELGKWWSISITGRFAEDFVGLNEYNKGIGKGGINEPRHNVKSVLFKSREFIKKIKHGDVIPFWYGFACYNFNCDVGIYMPIPLNLIVAAWEWFKMKVLRPIKYDIPGLLVHRRLRSHYDIRDSLEALDRLEAQHAWPTHTNYHLDIDTIRKTLERLKG